MQKNPKNDLVHGEGSQKQFQESRRVQNPEINADSGNWTSSELPEMNKMVQLQIPRRLRLLNCFTVGRLHSYTASAKKWNEQRCTTDNWMKCKCKHFQIKQLPSLQTLCKDLNKRLHKSAQIGASSRVAMFEKSGEPRTPKGIILLFSFHIKTLWTSWNSI